MQRNGTKPALMHRTLRGLPELEQFELEEQRQRALREIEREAGNPLTWEWVIGASILIAVVVTTVFALRWLVTHVPILGELPGEARDVIRIGITLVVFFITLRWLHRWGAGEQLREKLIAAGVPVCRGCGYSLKGHTPDATKCPECGRDIDGDVKPLMRPPAGEREPDRAGEP